MTESENGIEAATESEIAHGELPSVPEEALFDDSPASSMFPAIIELLSVIHRSSDDYYFVTMIVQAPLETAEPEEIEYVLGPTDPYGMAPELRVVVEAWVQEGNPVGEYVEPPPPPAPPKVVALGDFWTRITDEEAEQFDDAMMAKPIRLRRLYMAEQSAYTEHTELFDAVSEVLADLFGDARRDELLT